MSNELNKFLNELKTIIQNGYTKNGRQFLGTSGSGIFTIINFKNATEGFSVQLKKPSRSDMPLTPTIAIHSITPDLSGFLGGNKSVYVFNVEMFFSNQEKTVDAVKISEEELARYFLEEMNLALENCKDQFSTARVMSLNRLPGVTQEGKYNNTNLYGFTARAEVVLG